MKVHLYLLLGQVLCDLVLVDDLPALPLLPLDALDAFALHVAGADQHALERAQAEVVVALGGQLLVTQPAKSGKRARTETVSRSLAGRGARTRMFIVVYKNPYESSFIFNIKTSCYNK